jgi:hypothetical protein
MKTMDPQSTLNNQKLQVVYPDLLCRDWIAAGTNGPSGEEEIPEPDPDLEETVKEEYEYLRNRLKEELGREPTDEELDEWLRRHTEAY